MNGESHPLRGESIDVRHFVKLTGVANELIRTEVVDKKDNNVWLTLLVCLDMNASDSYHEEKRSLRETVGSYIVFLSSTFLIT